MLSSKQSYMYDVSIPYTLCCRRTHSHSRPWPRTACSLTHQVMRVEVNGLYGGANCGQGPRTVWFGGMAPDITDAQLTERIGAHQAREGSGAAFTMRRVKGGAWVSFTKASLAQACLTAMNGTVITGPKGSSSTLRIRYAAYLEDTATAPAVKYLTRPLPSAPAPAVDMSEDRKPQPAASAPATRGDAPASKRLKTEEASMRQPTPHVLQGQRTPSMPSPSSRSVAQAAAHPKHDTGGTPAARPPVHVATASAVEKDGGTRDKERGIDRALCSESHSSKNLPPANGAVGASSSAGDGRSAAVQRCSTGASSVAQPVQYTAEGTALAGPGSYSDMLRISIR